MAGGPLIELVETGIAAADWPPERRLLPFVEFGFIVREEFRAVAPLDDGGLSAFGWLTVAIIARRARRRFAGST